MTDHVKHMGFELELAAIQIVRALAWVPPDQREVILQHLAPKKLATVVKGMLQ